MKTTTIHDLPRIDRPREKLIKYGAERLSDAELLAILLRTGRKGLNVVEMSKKFLKTFSYEQLSSLNYSDLKDFDGLGPAKSTEIVAFIELGKRILKEKKSSMFLKPEDVWEEMKDLRENKKEHFVIMYLDSRNQEIKRDIISIGTLNASLVHPREVFEPAIRNLAASIMLVHNHPSNNPEPSEADLEITEKLIEAGELLDICITDHVIVCKDTWYSFKEKGLV